MAASTRWALYAEAVRLLKANQYQEALEQWGEVQARDPKYPDRQHVSSTAQKKLAALAKPAPRKRQISRRTLVVIGSVAVIVAAVIAGFIFFNGLRPRATMYDDFRSYKDMTLQSPIFFEAKLKLDPEQNAGNVLMGPCCGKLDMNCMVAPCDNSHQVASCWLTWNDSQFAAFPPVKKMITPGSWHTFRIEFDPGARVFTFFMDGERIGAYTADAAQLQGALPTFALRAHNDHDSPTAVKGYFDDVRIGPLQK
jgi:hypothetical protein